MPDPDPRTNGGIWGSPIEQEVHRRIQLCVATYAYEIMDTPIMSDRSWDRLAQLVRPDLGTCHPLIDEFFAAHFSPMTGMWIHLHPELAKIKQLYTRYYVGAVKEYCEKGVRAERRITAELGLPPTPYMRLHS